MIDFSAVARLDGDTSNSAGDAFNACSALLSDDQELEEIFTALTQWNDYLEHHVPYYSDDDSVIDGADIGGIEP